MNQDTLMPQQQQQPSFDDVPIEALEQLRMRLSQLTHSLNKLQTDMSQSTTLPQWSSLQNQLGVILSQLTSLSSTIDVNIEKLSKTDVFPVNTFPTSQEEGLLTTLLRKKHLPEISNWIEDSLTKVEQMDLSKDDKWCGWCLEKIELEIENFIFAGMLTKQEIENGGRDKKDEQLLLLLLQDSEVTGLSIDQINRFIYQGTDPNKK